MTTPKELGVWLHGMRVATITAGAVDRVLCQYTADALEAFPANSPLLSCSLPLGKRRQDASVFFAGMLPEGQALQALAEHAQVPTNDTFGLLARYGRDVAGAAVISDEPPGARDEGVAIYDGDDLHEAVAALPERPLDLHDDSELSIAGLQSKLLLVDLGDGRWGRPVHGRPSTHILKVEDRRYPGMAEREAACLRLARAVGLTTVDAQFQVLADIPCLIVSRFDRVVGSDGSVMRVHQEDACQALGRDPRANQRRGKFHDGGGPGLDNVADILDRWATNPVDELTHLLRAATYTVAIGNADAHGKNLAVLHRNAETVELAPLYDTVPTALWPKLRRTPAMPFGAQVRDIDQITTEDLVAEAVSWRLDRDLAVETVRSCAHELRELFDADTPDDLRELVHANADRLLSN